MTNPRWIKSRKEKNEANRNGRSSAKCIHGRIEAGLIIQLFLWHGVVAMSAPRMAAQKTSDRQVQSFEGTVFAECFKGIL